MNRRTLLGLSIAGLLAVRLAAHGQAATVVAPAQSPRDMATEFIDTLGQRLLGALRQPGVTAQQRNAAVVRILLDNTDFAVVSARTLGRYGRLPDSDEFHEFSVLFSAYIIDLAIRKLGDLQVRSYAIGAADLMADGDVIVTTDVSLAESADLKVGWRVHLADASPRITDILVDGYSMTTHFNEQYRDWLSKAGLKGLVDKLRQQTRNSPSLALVRSVREATRT